MIETSFQMSFYLFFNSAEQLKLAAVSPLVSPSPPLVQVFAGWIQTSHFQLENTVQRYFNTLPHFFSIIFTSVLQPKQLFASLRIHRPAQRFVKAITFRKF